MEEQAATPPEPAAVAQQKPAAPQEQRASPRYPLHCRAAIRGNDNQLIYGETLDVSIGGASVLMALNIPKGMVVSLFLQMPAQRVGEAPGMVEVRTKVLYTAFSADHGAWRLGVQFLDVSADAQKKLGQALKRFA